MRITLYISIFLLGISSIGFAQENQNTNDTIPIVKDSTEIITQEEPPSVNSTVNDSDEVFVFVEVTPKYPGGEDARLNYLRENIAYPELAFKSGIQGTVYLSFIIEKDGRVSSVKVMRGIGGGCDEESIRVIRNMPIWEPAMQRGRAVRCQFNMPIRFVIEAENNSKENKPLSKKEQKKLKKQLKKEAEAREKAEKAANRI